MIRQQSCVRVLGMVALLSILVGVAYAAMEEQKLTADDAAAFDQLGRSVSVSGDTALVGAGLDDDNGDESGSAYVFVLSGGVWTQQQKLTTSDAAANDNFGGSVSVSGDTAIVGALFDDDAGSASGSAYVYVRSDGVWTEQQKLTAGDAAAGDRFGASVSISGDTAIVGANRDDDGGNSTGSAYVYVRSDGVWTEQQKLTASDAAADDVFGASVSVSGDTAIVGAIFDDDGGSESGSAYVFVRNGGVWTQQQKLTADDASAKDEFGISVSVSGDTAIVGAWFDDGGGSDSGSAYVFVRNGGVWTQQQKLTADDAAEFDYLGGSVSVSGDTTLVGAYADDDGGSDSGSAYVYVRSDGVWTQLLKLTAGDAAENDEFGSSVSLSGNTAIVGASLDDDGGSRSGSAYAFVGVVSEGGSCEVGPFHTADRNGDNTISLSELLRVIQFLNVGGFGCEVGNEDGYAPSDPDQDCCPHDSDYNTQDWTINLSEQLRLIQFFNVAAYHHCPQDATEDGYCPGP